MIQEEVNMRKGERSEEININCSFKKLEGKGKTE